MKEVLAFIGILALAASLWFLKEWSDKKVIDLKNEKIESLQETVRSKEDVLVKANALIDSGDGTIKLLKDTIKTREETITKNSALIDSDNETIKSLKDTIQTKEAEITKNNTIISSYQEQVRKLTHEDEIHIDKTMDKDNVYPDDNGFDAQDLGSGFFAYQIFGPLKNPTKVQTPNKLPNHTPWKFGGSNSGIAANGSGFYLTGAINKDNNGATSSSGQAAFLQFAGGMFSQSMMLSAGTYTVTFDYEGRRDYAPANQIAVYIDGTRLFKGAPDDFNNFKRATTSPITITTSGEHELMFRGLGGIGDISGDHTTFIDNVYLHRTDFQKIGAERHNLNFDNPDHTTPTLNSLKEKDGLQ